MDLSFDINRTKAILIGSPEYDNFENIPPITNNLAEFQKVLSDQDIIGIPQNDNIYIIDNHDNNKTYERIIGILENEDNIECDTLFFYYVGHGYREKRKKELLLASKNSNKVNRFSFIPFNAVKEELESSHFQNLIIIIDACHSGLAAQNDGTEKLTNDEITITKKEKNKGAYVIASSPANEKSFFDKDNRHTFFTGEFLEIIKKGVDEKKEFIELENIYQSLHKNFKIKRLPEPQRKSTLLFQEFYFCKNIKSTYLKQKETEKHEKKTIEYGELFEVFYADYQIDKRERKILKSRQSDLQLTDSVVKLIEENIINRLEKLREKSISKKIEEKQIEDWKICVEKNTILDYENFAKKYQVGEYVKKAYIQINILSNKKEPQQKKGKLKEDKNKPENNKKKDTKKEDIPKIKFNQIKPDSLNRNKVSNKYRRIVFVFISIVIILISIFIINKLIETNRKKQEDNFWLKAKNKSQNDTTIYSQYLADYPNGKYVAYAIDSIRIIKERNDFNKTIRLNQITGYKQFEFKYPQSEYIRIITDSITSLKNSIALKKRNDSINTIAQSGEIVWLSDDDGYFLDMKDKEKYKVKKFKTNIWMVENFRYLPSVCQQFKPCGIWVYGYNGDDINAIKENDKYSKVLYDKKNAINFAPKGWKLPSKRDFDNLLSEFGGRKKAISSHFYKQDNFNVQLTGVREGGSGFNGLMDYTKYWTNTSDEYQAYSIYFSKEQIETSKYWNRSAGLSVRYIKE